MGHLSMRHCANCNEYTDCMYARCEGWLCYYDESHYNEGDSKSCYNKHEARSRGDDSLGPA